MKRVLSILFAITCVVAGLTPATAMERATPDEGNPRVVYIGGCTGFLYSPRIVLTAAHCLYWGDKDANLRVVSPGKRIPSRLTNSNSVGVVKRIPHPEYRDRVFGEGSRTNDFAVLVLEKPLAQVSTAKLASEEAFVAMAEARAEVIQTGYGLQSVADRESKNPREVVPMTGKFNLVPKQEALRRIQEFVDWADYVNSYPENLVMVSQPFGGPQLCDGDSGSGFYQREGDEFTYLGVLQGPLGITNCRYENPQDYEWGKDAIVGIFPVHRGLDLIAQAEKFVAQNPVVEKKAKNLVLPAFGSSLTETVKARIRTYVEGASGATKFVCTSVRLSTTSRTQSIAMRAKAKAVCDYAKRINPSLSTWVQSKASTKQSAVGMQLITIKFD